VRDQRDLEAVTRQLEGRVTFTRGKGTVFDCGSTE
jgi:hypothetical protein